MPKFSLAATGASPWFQLLGRGRLFAGLAGTWTGTAVLQRRGPDGSAYPVEGPAGTALSFTANSAALELRDPGPYRFDFTRSTGTLEPFAYSGDGAIYFPNADAIGGGLTFEQLPTADPEVENALWNNSGVVTVSAG